MWVEQYMGATLSTLQSIGDEPTNHRMTVFLKRASKQEKIHLGTNLYIFTYIMHAWNFYVSKWNVCAWGRMAIGKDSDNIQCK